MLTDFDRRLLVDSLGRHMAEISDCHLGYGWKSGHEDRLPAVAKLAADTGRPQRYGGGNITPAVGRQLLRLAVLAGSWAIPAAANDPCEWEFEPHTPSEGQR